MIDHDTTTGAASGIDETERAEALLDALDPRVLRTASDPHELRRIGEALTAGEAADAELRAAVGAARRAGYTWGHIGLTLGITRQAAQARFRE